jgi:hypothetical protein
LFDGPCNAGQTRIVSGGDGSRDMMLFTTPAVRDRTHLTGYISRDGGRTWTAGNVISEKSGGYSDCAAMQDGTILTLYENGRDAGNRHGLLLARFNLAWLTSGKDAPASKARR